MSERETPRVDARDYIESRVIRIPFSGCWIWMGAQTSRGYGSAWFNNRPVTAHRLSYIAFTGESPDDLFVLHRCDVPLCVNPAHLFLGDDRTNLVDAYSKRRRGKIGPSELREIYSMHDQGLTGVQIARHFGVNKSSITIRLRKRSAHGLL
jgi:hypothetical protein